MPKKVPAPKVVTLPQADAAPLETLKKVRNAVVVGTRKLKKKEGKLSGMRVKLAKHVGAASTVVALLSQFKTAETLVDGIAERMTDGRPTPQLRQRLTAVEREGGHYRTALLDADPEGGGRATWDLEATRDEAPRAIA